MRRSLHHLRKECQHYEVSISVQSEPRPQGFTQPNHFPLKKLWAWGWFRTTIVGHVIRSLILLTCFYNWGDHSRGTGEDAHQNDGTKPLRRPIWTKLKLYLPLKNRFHVAMMMSIGYSSFVIWILPKNFICPSGKLRIEITNPLAKSTNPGISDTTFFARCQKFILRRLQRPVAIQAKLAFLLLTQEDKKRLCYGRVRQQLLSCCCCCCLCFRLLSLFSHGQL